MLLLALCVCFLQGAPLLLCWILATVGHFGGKGTEAGNECLPDSKARDTAARPHAGQTSLLEDGHAVLNHAKGRGNRAPSSRGRDGARHARRASTALKIATATTMG